MRVVLDVAMLKNRLQAAARLLSSLVVHPSAGLQSVIFGAALVAPEGGCSSIDYF